MSVEHTYRCDGPECGNHGLSQKDRPPFFITTYDFEFDGVSAVSHFCSWDCLMKFAAKIPPPEAFDGSVGDGPGK